MSVLTAFKESYKGNRQNVLSLDEYFEEAKTTPLVYANAFERMVAAIGKPVLVDTSTNSRLSIIHQNRTIKIFPSFSDFYGIEAAIEKIYNYFVHAAQGLEESKQILYLLGPVGSSKSSIAERLKQLMEINPIYVLAFNGPKGLETSPIFETPLGLFDVKDFGSKFEDEYGIDRRYLASRLSPWATKRLDSVDGDISKFSVVKIHPDIDRKIGIMKTEPGDENNQDITTLVGKTNIRMLERFDENDVDSYSFSGTLNRTTQGLMEFVEMFKSPIKVLHPLLTATQERNYADSQNIGAIPFQGIVLAHSNESEWESFKNNKNNEAFIDRVCTIKIPYNLRVDEEVQIYKKMIDGSSRSLRNVPIAPKTLDFLAQFSVLSRLKAHENSDLKSKLAVYNGENIKESSPKARSIQEYRDAAGVNEGMSGISTRFAFKILSDTLSRDISEIAADPVLLIDVLNTRIIAEEFPKEREAELLEFVKVDLMHKYIDYIGKEIRAAYLENSEDYGQTLFDKYINYADCWLEEKDYKDDNTGLSQNRAELNKELEAIEIAAGVANPKDFRNEVVKYALRHRSQNNGANPKWTSYNKLKEVIEKSIFSTLNAMLPVISFGKKDTAENEAKHTGFIERMKEKGYTVRQARRVVEFYVRTQKAG